jgi:6-phosphogluconate dehydrogenase
MGGNMSRRLMKAGHHCVVLRANRQDARSAGKGRRHSGGVDCRFGEEARRKAARRLADVAGGQGHRRDGRATQRPAGPDDIIIDGGNSFYKDDIRRAKNLR